MEKTPDTDGLTIGKDAAAIDEMYNNTLKDFTSGSIVPGKVLRIHDGEVLIDIGYKSEALINGHEFTDFTELSVGDEIEVFIECLEDKHGMVVLSKKHAEQQRKWDHIVNECEEGSLVKGVVTRAIKGGLIIDIGADAFLPGSQIDVVPVRNLDDYMGKTIEVKILKINKERKNIVVSRREIIEESRREQKQKLLAEIKVGELRKGTVKNITDFGAFIDLTGIDGLLHVTDMSWGRINHPTEVVKVGQNIEVVILEVDLEKERISLGLKQTLSNPWKDIDAKYPIGTRIRGAVVSLAPYGAFVQIEDGVEGLVHVSEISWTKRIQRASDVMAIGDEVETVVLNINVEDKKISLGMRQTEENPWEVAALNYPIGSVIKGKVRNFTTYGAFVEIEEGIDGMIHVSDMSWTRKINHPSEVLNKGDEVEAVVLEIDASNQRISLGLKQAQEDPWVRITEKYKEGQKIQGKVTKLANFGAFVKLEDGIDGLVHISQISSEHVENVKNVLNIGDEVEARIVKIDSSEHRIGLSIKAAAIDDEDFEISDELLTGLKPGEELVDLSSAFEEINMGGEWHPGEKAE